MAGPAATFAFEVSFDGSRIVGWADAGGGFSDRLAAIWDAGVLSYLMPTGHPEGVVGYLIDVSATGRVTGSTLTGQPSDGSFVSDGVVLEPIFQADDAWDCGTKAISEDGSTWVGLCAGVESPVGFIPARWREGELAFLTETYAGEATDVSADGSVVVGSVNDGVLRRPFVWVADAGFHFVSDLLNSAGVDTSGVPLGTIYGVHVSHDGRTIVGDTFVARVPEPQPVPEADSGVGCFGAVAALAARALSSRRGSSCRGSRTGRAAAGGSSPPALP
jgi:hypothetical protein